MIRMIVIEPTKSEWAPPIVFAAKKDGSLRLSSDYRKLNDLNVKDTYPDVANRQVSPLIQRSADILDVRSQFRILKNKE